MYKRMEASGIRSDDPEFFMARSRFEAAHGSIPRAEALLQGAVDAGRTSAGSARAALGSLSGGSSDPIAAAAVPTPVKMAATLVKKAATPFKIAATSRSTARALPADAELEDTVELPGRGRWGSLELPDTQKLSLRAPPDMYPEALMQRISLSAPPAGTLEPLAPELADTIRLDRPALGAATPAPTASTDGGDERGAVRKFTKRIKPEEVRVVHTSSTRASSPIAV